MTATVTHQRQAAASSFGRFAGLRALVRKDVREWSRGRRGWVVFIITALFMVVTSANAWLLATLRDVLPADVEAPAPPVSLAPLENFMGAVGTQIFILAAVFAVASLIVRERESGTLAWVASKPVARRSIWVSKWVSASVILVVAAVILPIAVTVGAVVAMYGIPDIGTVAIVTVGAAAAVVFYATLGLAAGAVLPGQPAVIATGFMVFALVPLVVGLVPLPIAPYLPTSILSWAVGAASGADVGWVTPVAWAVGTVLVAAIGIRQTERMEL